MNIKKIVSIILVVIWMSVIFGFSNQQEKESSNASRKVCEIIVDVVNIVNKYTDIEKENIINILEPFVRKIAHYTIYLAGGILISNCVYQFQKNIKKSAFISLIIGIMYAICDELHQLMVAGRSGRVIDVIIDSLGIMTGVVIFLLLKQICKKVANEKNKIRG
mgnify:CR=1 FL=1